MFAFPFLILAIGFLLSWLGSFLLYGFGQLIENSDILASTTSKILSKNKSNKETHECKNCGFMVRGAFCTNCGAKSE